MRDRGSSNGGRTRRQLLAVVDAATTAGLAGCATPMASGDDFDIGMIMAAFDPLTVTVETGDEAVRHDASSRGHTVTACEDALPEGAAFSASGDYETGQTTRDAYSNSPGEFIGSGGTYTYSSDVSGEYEYLCIPHEQADMAGAIVAEG